MNCPWCYRWAPADPHTGYDADGPCSRDCEDALQAMEARSDEEEARDDPESETAASPAAS